MDMDKRLDESAQFFNDLMVRCEKMASDMGKPELYYDLYNLASHAAKEQYVRGYRIGMEEAAHIYNITGVKK